MRLQTIAEARCILVILVSLALVGWLFSDWIALIFLVLILYTLYFFRDPEREVPADPKAVVAAADGTIADITEVEETDLLKTKTRRVGIFLSIFDVHINRAPVDGKIIYRQHREGVCFDARSPECSEKNEALTWGFENPQGTFVVRQLTGAIARRIVAWSDVGDELQKGDRFGMIRFGSRTEVYLPLAADVLVNVGDHVAGGSTIIARLP
jgi:phosphatidylserine decarboxylase